MMDMGHREMRFSEGPVTGSLEYYDKRLEKVFHHPGLKEIHVGSMAPILTRAKAMAENNDDFLVFSRLIAEEWFEICLKIENMPDSSLVFAHVRYEGEDWLAVLKLNYKSAPTLLHERDEAGRQIMRIALRPGVPAAGQGGDEAILVNVDRNRVYLLERRFMIDGRMSFYLNEQYLHGETQFSDREMMRMMTKAVNDVNEQYHVVKKDPNALIKQALVSKAELLEDIKPNEVAAEIFAADEDAREECLAELDDLGIAKDAVMRTVPGLERMTTCRLELDTGMKVTLNVADYLNENHVKVVTEKDGTLTVTLTDIHEIIVK